MCSSKLVPHHGYRWMGFMSSKCAHVLKALNEPSESGGRGWLNLPLEGAPRALTTHPEYTPMRAAGPDPPAQ